jgi:hypothetical protein
MASSWQVRLAAALTGVTAVFGLGLLVLASRVLRGDPGFLFAVLPFVFLFLGAAGSFLLGASLTLTLRLLFCARGVRLHTALLGGLLCFMGIMVVGDSQLAALALVLQGGGLVWLMTTPGAVADLGGWLGASQPPAPWGSTPGTGLWSSAPPQQGPWSPDPRTLPIMSWKGHSGPRPPWWQTWQDGLAQGIPLWELVLLCVALLGWLVALVAVPFALAGSAYLGTLRLRTGQAAWLLLLLPASLAVVVWLERRMRARLAQRRR